MEERELTNIEKFVALYFNHDLKYKVPSFHKDMYQLLEEGHRRIVVAAPRSFAKSTVFTKFWTLYNICVKDVKKILIISETSEFAEDWLTAIKDELAYNKPLIAAYGNMRTNAAKWNEQHIKVTRRDGSTVQVKAKGWGKQIRGYRPDLIMVDDIENDDQAHSEDQRNKLNTWWNKAMTNTVEKESQIVLVGTVIHPLALLLKKIKHSKIWTSRLYKALVPSKDGGEESIWPEKWPFEALMERQEEIGRIAFNSEFMNTPIISENPIFLPEHMQGYDNSSLAFEEECTKTMYTTISIDPAISKKESSDFTAITAVSSTFGPTPKTYVRVGGIIRGHWPIHKQVEEVVRTYDKFEAAHIIVETTAYQEALADEIRRYLETNRRFIKIVQVKPDKDKERRAHAVVPMIERGQVLFDHSDQMTQRLMDEMLVFPTGDRDDLVDSLVYNLTEHKRWRRRKNVTIQSGVGASW